MSKKDDAETVTTAEAEECKLRRLCAEGTERYRAALTAAGYLKPSRRVA